MVKRKYASARDPDKEKFWRERFQRFENSGLSVKLFCEREGITESLFYSWRKRIRSRDAEIETRKTKNAQGPRVPTNKSVAAHEFVPVNLVTVANEPEPSRIEITSPTGFVVHVTERASSRLLHLALLVLKDISC